MFTDAEVIALCTLIAGFDNRFDNDRAARAAWRASASAEGWSFAEAAAAVTRFYTRPREADEGLPRIAPGHITSLIRGSRAGTASAPPARQVLDDPVRGLTRAGGSSPEHRAKVRAELDAKMVRQLEGRPSSVRPRRPWHDGPVERPQRAIDAARVKAIARTAEAAAESLAGRLDASGS